MRAVAISRHGPPEVLEVQERPDPPVGPGEIRIAVRASGINFADTLARIGLYPDAPKPPCVVGYEVAGEIESVGEGVESHKVGDRVMAGTRFNGQAELVTVPEAQVLPLPKKVSFEQGAAFPGQLRDGLCGPGDHGWAQGGGPRADPCRRRRSGHLGHPDREGDRRRDLRDRVRFEA